MKLDQLELDAKAGRAAYPNGSCLVLDTRDVLRLIAVARAARSVADRHRPPKEVTNDFNALRSALADLDAQQEPT